MQNTNRKTAAFFTLCRKYMSLILTFISLCLIAGSSIAWMSLNKQVDSQGNEVTVATAKNLVISVSSGSGVGGIKSKTILDDTSNPYEVSFTAASVNLNACSNNWSTGTATGLYYVSNMDDVDADKGTALSGSTLSYSAVPVYDSTKDTERYYIDYVVYIASAGANLGSAKSSYNLNVNITSPAVTNASTPALMAASVDFYVGTEVSSSTYKGTLNFAGLNNDNVSGAKTSATIYTGPIPKNTSDYLTITMRCYFDGNLQDSNGNTYVKSKDIDVDVLPFTVNFSAVSS